MPKLSLIGFLSVPLSVFAFTVNTYPDYFTYCKSSGIKQDAYMRFESDIIVHGRIAEEEVEDFANTITHIQADKFVKGHAENPIIIKQLGCSGKSGCFTDCADCYGYGFPVGQSGLIYLAKSASGYRPICPGNTYGGENPEKIFWHRIGIGSAIVLAVLLSIILLVLTRKHKKNMDSRLRGNDKSNE